MNNYTETFVTDYFEVKGFCPSQKLFVMTDLHGCSLAMNRLLKHYDGQSKVVFLGDAIDRGPDSFGVIKTLIDLDAICLLGNHESPSHGPGGSDSTRYESEPGNLYHC